MTARRLTARRTAFALALAGLIPTLAGCQILGEHKEKHIPEIGVIDPEQPRELRMVSLPPYVVEPPDELEVSVRPATLEILQSTLVVQPDGVIDMGFYGDVYVAGLTLIQIEQKIAEHVNAIANHRHLRVNGPIQASVRLANGSQSKRFYVLGTVTNQGSFPITGNETVLDGILTAGLRSNSLPEKAYVARPHPAGGPCQILKVDWEQIQAGETLTNYQILPGDRIYIPGGRPPGLLSTLLGGG